MAAPAHIARENGKKGGRPKGSKASHTLEAQEKKKRIIQRVNEATDVLIDAQLSLARGTSFLYRIDKDEKGKNKKPELVTTQYEIEAYLRGDYDHDPDSYYYITTVKPDNKAIDSLLDRVHGKANQSISGPDGKELRITFDNAFTHGTERNSKE